MDQVSDRHSSRGGLIMETARLASQRAINPASWGRLGRGIVIAAACFWVAGCGGNLAPAPAQGTGNVPSTQAAPPTAAFHTAVCLAVNDAQRGNWPASQNEWLAAKNALPQSAELTLIIDLLNLNIATASLRIDKLTAAPDTADLVKYQTALSALPPGTLTGC